MAFTDIGIADDTHANDTCTVVNGGQDTAASNRYLHPPTATGAEE